MKKYRLKKEALPFFKNELRNKIEYLHEWDKHKVDVYALEEVEPVHIMYGHSNESQNYNYTSLSGWDEKGTKLHFTIVFPSFDFRQNDVFTKGASIRDLMNEMQELVNEFVDEFNLEKK